MLNKTIIFALVLVCCQADNQALSQGVPCGKGPSNIAACLFLPSLYSELASWSCRYIPSLPRCPKITCLFNESGWLMEDKKPNMKKLWVKFETIAALDSDWAPAVYHAKVACFKNETLPPQGVYLDCPIFDFLHCAYTSFLRNAVPSLWVQTPDCQIARDYAANCPVCPDECFEEQVPKDSCHACYSLPGTSESEENNKITM